MKASDTARSARPLAVLCDFDGTITTRDLGEELCSRFAPGSLERVDARWLAGEIPFHEAYRLSCLELNASLEELVAHALARAELREGFPELVAACRETGAELIVASAGLDLYVRPVLQSLLGSLDGLVLRLNRGTVGAGGVCVEYPHPDPLCAECGSCKGLAARDARERGRLVVAVGDSYSDRCLVAHADVVFARAWLAEHCRSVGLAHETFDDFTGVVRLVRAGGR